MWPFLAPTSHDSLCTGRGATATARRLATWRPSTTCLKWWSGLRRLPKGGPRRRHATRRSVPQRRRMRSASSIARRGVHVSPSTFYEAQRSRTALPQASLLIVDSTAREANLSYKIREDETRLGSRHVAISSFSRQSVSSQCSSVSQSLSSPLHTSTPSLRAERRPPHAQRRQANPCTCIRSGCIAVGNMPRPHATAFPPMSPLSPRTSLVV